MKRLWLALEIGAGIFSAGLVAWYAFEGGVIGFLYAVLAGALGYMTVTWFFPLIFPRLFK